MTQSPMAICRVWPGSGVGACKRGRAKVRDIAEVIEEQCQQVEAKTPITQEVRRGTRGLGEINSMFGGTGGGGRGCTDLKSFFV